MDKDIYAELVVDNKSVNTDRLFTYKVPQRYRHKIKAGMRVFVPFGSGNKTLEGIVIRVIDTVSTNIGKIKPIISIIDNSPLLSDNMIKLVLWMRDKYLSQYTDVIKTVIPSGISKKVKPKVKLIKSFEDISKEDINSSNQRSIIEYLQSNGDSYIKDIGINLEIRNPNSSLTSLANKGIVSIYNIVESEVSKKFEKVVYKNFKTENVELIVKNLHVNAIKQKEIITYISKIKFINLKSLMLNTSSTLSTVRALEKKGLITIQEEEVRRNPINKEIPRSSKLQLTRDQQDCVDIIYSDSKEDKNKFFLIHGVTGSGKTEIYLQLIEKVLLDGKQSIVLVPEISLTPQTVERFVGRFGNRVAVLHSRLSLGERYDEWRKIKEGSVDIVVGARSAIFAPFNNLGLIIIDEEHETSYKSSMSPKYDTIEVAEERAKIEKSMLILGTATPSIETYYKAENGKFKLLSLPNRINGKPLPHVDVIDMREELNGGNKSILSVKLYKAIEENLINNMQTILFINRRGFSTFVSCRKCGYVAKCKECDISYTYHSSDNFLKCHYCGSTMKPPTVCPECGSKYIKFFGIGTQKVEEYVKQSFPNARIARMDMDTTSKKGSHETILNLVKNREVDILIGTQMITKGLDFPNVTLVGIIAGDTSLNIPDFRSPERTFQLITQVSGRAGRADYDGRVFLQTYDPTHYSLEAAKEHDYLCFYKKEIAIRREFNYPPFTNIFCITISSKIEEKLHKEVRVFSQVLKTAIKDKFNSFNYNNYLGPNPAPVPKIKGNYRWQIIIKCNDVEIELMKGIIKDIVKLDINGKKNSTIKVSIDINPSSIV